MTELNKITLALCLPIMMVCIDVMALSIALDAIVVEFHTPIYQTQWLFTAYMIANSAFLITTGQLADTYGRRKLLLLGISGFTLASLIAACSYNFWLLVIARGFQGITSAGIMTSTIALITSNFVITERSKIFARWMFAVGAGLAFGPLVGGIIIYLYDWRLIFLINIPIGVLSYWFVKKYLPESKANIHVKSKLLNALLLIITVTLFALLLSEGEVWGWLSETSIITFLVFLFSVMMFLYFEVKTVYPIIKPELYRKPLFVMAIVSGFFSYFFMYAWLFIFSIYLQEVRGLIPITSSFICISFSIAFAFGPLMLNKVFSDLGKKVFIQTGFLGVALAFILMSFSPISIPLVFLIVAFFLLGLSIATINIASMAIATNAISKDISGSISGVIFTMRWLGGAIGVVVITIIYHSITIYKLKGFLQGMKSLTFESDKFIPYLFENHISSIYKQYSSQADVLIPIIKHALTSSLTISCLILASLSLMCIGMVGLVKLNNKNQELMRQI